MAKQMRLSSNRQPHYFDRLNAVRNAGHAVLAWLPVNYGLFRLNSEISHPPVEVAAIDAHVLGRTCHIALEFGQFM